MTVTTRRSASLLVLLVLFGAIAAQLLMSASAAQAATGSSYSLAATTGPAALTAADCAADTACYAVTAPRGDGLDDYAAIAAVVQEAARSATSARPVTVFLGAGLYTVGQPIKLPANVNLRGAGMAETTLVIRAGSFAAFSYSFVVRPDDAAAVDGSSNVVSDLTVNGNCRTGAGLTLDDTLPATSCDHGGTSHSGGGIKVGDRWTVRHVRFTNLEYFKLWISGTTGVRVVDNRFDNRGGAGSGTEDNIGGGGFATDTLVEANQFDATQLGNSVDLVNATKLTVKGNTVYTDAAMLTRFDRPDNGSILLEAVTDAVVSGNTLHGAHIVLMSNAGYDHTGNNKDVTNPRGITVTDNRILGSYGSGITVAYTDYADADGSLGVADKATTGSTTDHTQWSGGGNVISGNTITEPQDSGILVFGCYDAAKTTADTITGNVVRNAGRRGTSTTKTGCGTFETVGVGISIGTGDKVYDNTVTDSAAAPGTWYGVSLGSRTAKTTLSDTVTSGNSSSGVVVGTYRYAASGTPEAPTAESGTRKSTSSTTVTWRESTALSGVSVGGYRVYRNGVLIADLPVGSASVPGNLLSDEAATLESGLGGWTGASRSSVSRASSGTSTAASIGTSSLAITATGAGQIGTTGPSTPVTAGQTYTATASYKAVTSGVSRKARTGIVWLDANGNTISSRLFTSNKATTSSTDGWVTSTFTAQAPAGAAYARVLSAIDDAQAGETHLMDRIGLVQGSATESFTDTSAPSGAVSYQIVAYRSGGAAGSQLSLPTVIAVN